ncbi:MAG: hypothetical protein SVU24_04830 [Pseudomonadota bacterium]|jgi:PBP1b-binding outer membrane lipoprotein LpoB|nr:hypothetical protein [Pseudomonadota bacterium]
MSWHKLIAPVVLVSAVALAGCSDENGSDEKAGDKARSSQQEPSAMDELKEEAGETMQAAGKVATEAKQAVGSKTSAAVDKAAEVGEKVEQQAKETYQEVKSGTAELGERAAETTEELTEAARRKMEQMQQEEPADAKTENVPSESN